MTEFGLDVAADQIVHWLKDKLVAGRTFQFRATREYSAEPVGNREEAGLSEETEAASLMTIGELEVWPAGAGDGWCLQVRVEDIVGPHTPEEESVPGRPEEIDLDDFEAEFISPDRVTAYVSVTAETPEAKRRFDRVFADLIRDRHSG